jgi:hypothetical protein
LKSKIKNNKEQYRLSAAKKTVRRIHEKTIEEHSYIAFHPTVTLFTDAYIYD